MNCNNAILTKLSRGKGFFISDALLVEEYQQIKSIVYDSIKKSYSLGMDYPDEEVPYIFRQYQKDYTMLNRSVFQRTLCKESCRKLSAIKTIRRACTDLSCEPADVHSLGYPSFTWRYTRPSQPHDIRSAHRDVWFRTVNKEPKIIRSDLPSTLQTIKFWLAVNVVRDKSGLMIAPYSQHRISTNEYTIQKVDNILKPVISDKLKESIKLQLAPLENSQFILFGEDLIHAGAPNQSNQARISLEFAMAHTGYAAKEYTQY